MKRRFTKKPILANTRSDWPSSREWRNADLHDDVEIWDMYLARPEGAVNDELQIYPEPSIQGGYGSMFIFDQSGQDRDRIAVDYWDWCDAEKAMAASSKSATEYGKKYRDYIISLLESNW